jgi:uncharacterized protein (TIGR03067 family)
MLTVPTITGLVAALLAWACPPSALGARLLADGYSAIPLLPYPGGNMFLVRCRYREHTLLMGLDTGAAAFAVLDDTVARRIGAAVLGADSVIEVNGVRAVGHAQLSQLTVGGYPTDGGSTIVKGLPEFRSPEVRERTGVAVDGLLGHRCLELYDGVVDYPGRTLFLRSPSQADLPRLAGEWACVRHEQEGALEPTVQNAGKRLQITGDRFLLGEGSGRLEFRMTLNGRRTPKKMDLWRSMPDGSRGGTYASYQLSGDRLLVCLATNPYKTERPQVFATAPGSGTQLLEFRRVKSENR